MSDDKKYYYLKLKDNFFDSEGIIVLESMPDGYLYSNILLKLYLRSLKNEGKLMFNDRLPYNATILSQVVRHPVEVVEKALTIFEEFGLIEVLDNGAIYMLDVHNYIGRSSSEADRQRDYYNRITDDKLLLETTCKKPCKKPYMKPYMKPNGKSTPELELELEKELELELEKDSEIKVKPKKIKEPFLSDSNEYRLSSYLWDWIVDNNKEAKKPNLQKWSETFDLIMRIDKREVENIKTVIAFCQKDEFWYKNILSPSTLRKHYDKLILQMKNPKYAKTNSNPKNQFVENCSSRGYDFGELEKKLLGEKEEEQATKIGINMSDYD